MKQSEAIRIDYSEALPYAVSLALHEAANRGWLTVENAQAVQERAETLYNALLDGKFLERQENGLYLIREPDDILTIGDDDE